MQEAVLADTKPDRFRTHPAEALPDHGRTLEKQDALQKKAPPLEQYSKKLPKVQMTGVSHFMSSLFCFHPYSPVATRKHNQI